MNKFRDMGGDKKSSPEAIETSKGIVDFTPTFEEGDVVKVKKSSLNYSTSLEKLSKLNCVVNYCKVADLGDMVTEVVYLKKTIKDIRNPYLVEHFEKV